MAEKTMREIDTEAPVVWPAWCYSGEASIEDTANSVNAQHQLNHHQSSTITNHRNKGKRKGLFSHPLDKMLSDRMINLADNKKFCDNSSGMFYDNNKQKCDVSMELIKTNGDLTVNNNHIKAERLSPQNGDHTGTTGASRSRSGTPSSYPGTPPQALHPSDIIGNSQNSSGTMKSDFQPRNYSDFIRSLAAKYNNNNPNDSSHSRNSIFESRFGNTAKNTKESPSPPDCKRLQPTAQSVPAQNSLISSMFPSGIAFPPAVFSPLIDMSSTQALVTLARAAKEAEIQNLLKGPTKRPNINTTPPSNVNQIPTSATTPSNQRFPLHTFSISNLSQQHPSPKSPSSNNQSSSSEQVTVSASPLDLSASTPVTKRVKLDTHSPNRSIGSPTHQRSLSSGGSCRTANQRKCQSQSDEINSWNVSQVCEFVGSIDICAEYVENFREQCIDGAGLPLLTEDHLTNSLGMKLGPALKLRSVLSKKLGGPCPCVSCTLSINATSPSGSIPRPSSVESGT
ncbi:hypothetical protein HA402_014254 [Bradysia odoriphaga]|nr:hypothetical protein HA402_014254 [Bradysia odoriphaga]